jgi:polyisoprenoid-binding protein YceI
MARVPRKVSYFWIALLASALSADSQAQQTLIKLDPAKTHIAWTLDDVLHTVEGTFAMKSGTITFNPQTGEAGGQIVVDAASGNSGNGTRDSKMKKEVLEVARYPEIVFTARHVTGFATGKESQTVEVAGEFAVHGATHPLTLTLPVTLNGTHLGAQTKFEVPYEKWGMKNPSTLFLKVSGTVQIDITASGELQSAAQ